MLLKTFECRNLIQRQLRDALSFINNYVIKEAVVKVPEKAESSRIVNYPYAAIEEILANAVYHRSYQVNEPITVRIIPDQIEITSFPGFDRSITDEAIEKEDVRAKIYRNRRIGDFLKELGLIEDRNTGFPNAREALENNGSPKLEFDMNPERDYISVIIKVHEHFKQPEEVLSDYELNILSILSKNTLSLTELSNELGYKGITAKLSRTVNSLVAEKKLENVLGEDNKPKLGTINRK